jgi:hypothetical protein
MPIGIKMSWDEYKRIQEEKKKKGKVRFQSLKRILQRSK